MAVVASRTPEGEPAECMLCGRKALVSPSNFPTADAPCPSCGSLLWLSGSPEREFGDEMSGVINAMRAAIQRGAERLADLKWPALEPDPPAEAEPDRAELGLREVTDPAGIQAAEDLLSRS
ncbi:MAG: hypothetical protein ACJ8C4_21185 [Gemmataceae bacterium]